MRNILLFTLTVISFYCNSQDFSGLSFGTTSTFEIMTWNIEDFPKNGQTTINQVKDVLEALDVDFICFQEIEDSIELKRIAANLDDYEVYFEPGFWSGLAIMYKASRVNISSIYQIYDAPTYWSIFPRTPLVIEMEVDNHTITVINNHFKCCGDGIIDADNLEDEETKRLEASNLLKQFIDGSKSDEKVIVIGDLNDELTDDAEKNVFQPFLDDNLNYRFADLEIANGSSANWSYPLWPSHLDHILVTNELFELIESDDAVIETIKIDEYLEDGIWDYDDDISDHRPVAMRLNLNEEVISSTYDLTHQINWNIFPNPSVSSVVVKFPKDLDNIILHIYSSNGKLVELLNVETSLTTLDVSKYARGIYFVQLFAANKLLATQKLVLTQ